MILAINKNQPTFHLRLKANKGEKEELNKLAL